MKIRAAIAQMAPYPVPETACRIKLDAMENPYPFPDWLREELGARLQDVALNRYPDPTGSALRNRIARYAGVRPEQVALGNGSDELIQMLLLTLGEPGSAVCYPTPTFAMYGLTAIVTAHRTVEVPLRPDWSLDVEGVTAALRRERPALLFLAYPNNPTGNCFDLQAMETLLQEAGKTDTGVAVDEAYIDFSGRTLVPLLERFEHLAILRTFSKLGLAGLRLGYLLARAELIEQVHKVRLPYNVGRATQALADLLLDHRRVLKTQVRAIRSERERLYQALGKLPGVTPFPSDANFLLFRSAWPADAVHAALLQKGILIKNLSRPGLLERCLRVTVGTPEENDAFLEAMMEIVYAQQTG
jgi:histidinol-phosphate aminotransferase